MLDGLEEATLDETDLEDEILVGFGLEDAETDETEFDEVEPEESDTTAVPLNVQLTVLCAVCVRLVSNNAWPAEPPVESSVRTTWYGAAN